jgi:CRISPR/Cas system-associated exonuclease Cas4 (RecB family)
MAASKSDLWKFLDTKKTPTRLIGNIERHLLQRPVGDRSTTVLHPSEIIKKDFCHRSSYFLLSGYTKIAEKPNLRLQSIFDEGHAIHAKWQSWFQEMGVLYGRFTCTACDFSLFDLGPVDCPACGKATMEYREVTLIDDSLRIAGHTDGWIKGIGDDTLIEIKSIGPGTIRNEAPSLMQEADGDFMKAWKLIRKPFGVHVLQGQVYLELMQRMGHDVNEIVFIYELKADQDYKEFTVKRDYELVSHVFDKAELIVNSVEAGVAPDCNNNPGGTCKQCAPYKED